MGRLHYSYSYRIIHLKVEAIKIGIPCVPQFCYIKVGRLMASRANPPPQGEFSAP